MNIANSIELFFLKSENDYNFNVIPNPSNGIFNITIEDKHNTMIEYPVIIYNSLGHSVLQIKSLTKIISLNMTGYSKGFYLIKIDFNNILKIKKLVLN
jgi:Secretion system C-terminal sorting domain